VPDVPWIALLRLARQRKSDPPEGGFLGFQRAARVSHAANIAGLRAEVNELLAAIHAAETSPL
jgi:hypothetical protein